MLGNPTECETYFSDDDYDEIERLKILNLNSCNFYPNGSLLFFFRMRTVTQVSPRNVITLFVIFCYFSPFRSAPNMLKI